MQQRQGKVQPNKQIGKFKINDNSALEKQADEMGKKAANNQIVNNSYIITRSSNNVIQGVLKSSEKNTHKNYAENNKISGVPPDEIWPCSHTTIGLYDDKYFEKVTNQYGDYEVYKIINGDNQGNYVAKKIHVENKNGYQQYSFDYVIGYEKFEDFKSGNFKESGEGQIYELILAGETQADYHMDIVKIAFEKSGGTKTGFDFENNASWDQYGTWQDANNFSNNAILTQDYSNINPDNFINILLGGFIYGTGPQTYHFYNDKITEEVANSPIMEKSMKKWYKKNKDAYLNDKPYKAWDKENEHDYGMKEQTKDVITEKSFLSISNFIGSSESIKIVPNGRKIVDVILENKTNKGSGDYFKIATPIFGEKAKSWERKPNNKYNRPYSTIYQYYYFSIPIDNSKFKQK